jgi:four helix bundle protein
MTFNEKYKANALLIKTFNFVLNSIDYTTELQEQKKSVIANQLLKSGTSIGANSKESQNAKQNGFHS